MARCAAWIPYAGTSALLVATLLLAVAGTAAHLGRRLRSPLRARRPGVRVGVAFVVSWLVGVTTFVLSALVYMQALREQSGQSEAPASPVAPVTGAAALITFGVIVYLVRSDTFRVAVGSAVVGTIAAPMIFELPFDLVVMWRTCPPSPAVPFTLLYFLPLLMVAVTSVAMPTLSPAMRLTRYTLFALASMFIVFAIWAIFGFGYPADPLSLGLNVIGKLLAFVVAGSLFVPDRRRSTVRHRRGKHPLDQGDRTRVVN